MKASLLKKKGRGYTAALFVCTTVVACGGGGGGASEVLTTPAPPATDFTLTGVAATGAPMSGATIRVYDGSGKQVGADVNTAADGSYAYVVPKEAVAPLVVSAARDTLTLYAPVAERKSGVANVTPLTNLAAVQLSPTGDAAALAGQISAGTATVTSERVAQVVASIMSTLKPLLDNVGDQTDPITGVFKADGSGHDRVLNALTIAVNTTGTGANISITVKASVSAGEQAPAVVGVSAAPLPVLPVTVATAALPAADIDALVVGLYAQLTRCYALPLELRVSSGTSPKVVAPECNNAFKGNDAANYRHNGIAVGPSGAFSGIFGAGGTGVVFDRGVLEHSTADGSLLLTYRATGASGNSSYGRLVAVREGSELKLAGNQYAYSAAVQPWAEDREFANDGPLSYLNSGFNINIPNRTAGGKPVFDRVLVTTPTGIVLTYRPQTGLSYLTFQRADGTLAGTSVLRMTGRFVSAQTAGAPRTTENTVWAPNPAGADADWTDGEIAAIPNIGTWKLQFFNAGNSGETPDTTQYLQTLSRPFTMAEMTQKPFAQPTAAFRAEATAASSATRNVRLGAGDRIEVAAQGGDDGWTVPAGAYAPLQINAFGRTSASDATRWDDSVTFAASARKATITCSAQTSTDTHCASSGYAAGALFNQLQWTVADPRDVIRVKTLSLFKPS